MNVIFVVVVFILMNVNPVLEHQENFYIIYEVFFLEGGTIYNQCLSIFTRQK